MLHQYTQTPWGTFLRQLYLVLILLLIVFAEAIEATSSPTSLNNEVNGGKVRSKEKYKNPPKNTTNIADGKENEKQKRDAKGQRTSKGQSDNIQRLEKKIQSQEELQDQRLDKLQKVHTLTADNNTFTIPPNTSLRAPPSEIPSVSPSVREPHSEIPSVSPISLMPFKTPLVSQPPNLRQTNNLNAALTQTSSLTTDRPISSNTTGTSIPTYNPSMATYAPSFSSGLACIASEKSLRLAISLAVTDPAAPTLLVLCTGILTLSTTIDWSGKAVQMSCFDMSNTNKCIISGIAPLFVGAPALASMTNLVLEQSDDSDGSCLSVSGGGVVILRDVVVRKCAGDFAVTVAEASNLVVTRGYWQDNDGGLYATTDSYVSLEQTTLDGQPVLIDGGAVVLENSVEFRNGSNALVNTGGTMQLKGRSIFLRYDANAIVLAQRDGGMVTCEDSVVFCDGEDSIVVSDTITSEESCRLASATGTVINEAGCLPP